MDMYEIASMKFRYECASCGLCFPLVWYLLRSISCIELYIDFGLVLGKHDKFELIE